MTEHTYDAVHVHLGYRGALALLCAKNCGIKTRIVHAHIAYEQENFKQKCIRKAFTVPTKLLTTHLAACGVDAGKWVWGEKDFANGKVKVHNNAIATKRFAFSAETSFRKYVELYLHKMATLEAGLREQLEKKTLSAQISEAGIGLYDKEVMYRTYLEQYKKKN